MISFRARARGGFTLVELLVVIGIIAILAGVILAALSSAINSAHRSACLSQMHAIGTAVITYGGDNNLDFPYTDNPAWDVPLNPYIGGQSTAQANPILRCPSDTRPLTTPGKFARSYSFNGNVPHKLNQVLNASQMIMLSEWYSGGTVGPGGGGSNFQYSAAYCWVVYTVGNCPPQPNGNLGYHGGTSNFLFVDGHAESLDPNSTFTPISLWDNVR